MDRHEREDRWDHDAERIGGRERNKRKEGRRRGGCKGLTTQTHSQPWRKKKRKTYKIEKGFSQEAKHRWDNLRGAG